MIEIVVDAQELVRFLKIGPVSKSNGNGTMPILKHIHISGSPRKVEARATDLITSMTTRLRGHGTGSICVPAGTVLKALNGRRETLAVFSQANEDGPAELRFAGSSFSLPALKPEEFPVTPKVPTNGWCPITFPALDPLLAVIPKGITQYESLSVGLDPAGVTYVATDGHRLVVVQVNGGLPVEKRDQFLLPRDSVHALARLRAEHLFLSLPSHRPRKNGNNFVHFRDDGDLRISIRPVDSKFPDYREVIPDEKNAECIVEVDRQATLAALKDARPFITPTSTRVELAVTLDSKLTFSVRNDDLGGFTRQIPAKSVSIRHGFGLSVGFNGHYLADLAEFASGETVRIELCGEEAPLVLREPDRLHLLMPLRD